MIHFIEHIIEPEELLLVWQSPSDENRIRHTVAKLQRNNGVINLTYLSESSDFHDSQKKGFEFYPAFREIEKTHENVIDTFMRRLPPRNRLDFKLYLENFRIKPDVEISDFALLGYTGAKLPSDGFSIVHPFTNARSSFEALVEITGFRFLSNSAQINIGDAVSFKQVENHNVTKEPAIEICAKESKIGYVPRAMVVTFNNWLQNKRIIGAWIEKTNGTVDKPRAYIFVKISEMG